MRDGIKVLPFQLGMVAGETAVGGEDLVNQRGVRRAGTHLQIDHRMVFAFEYDFHETLGVTGKIYAVHNGKYLGIVIAAKQLKRLVEWVRAGVEEISGVHALQGLPVPAPGETVEIHLYHDNASKDSGVHDFLDFQEGGGETGLLEDSEENVVSSGGFTHPVNLGASCGQRFFREKIVSCLHDLDVYGNMLMAHGSIYHKVNVIALEHLTVVLISLAAAFRHAFPAAFNPRIAYGNDLEFVVEFLGNKVCRVNVTSASPLADDGSPDFFHLYCFPF